VSRLIGPLVRPGRAWRVTGIVASVAAIAVVTALIYGLRELAPVVSLGALYVFAVVPIAIVWGLPFAIPVAVGSMLAFNFFFLPPVHTFTLADERNWAALAVYLVTALVVSDLAARSRRRAVEAEQQRREEALLAELALALLQGEAVTAGLRRLAGTIASVLRVESARFDPEPVREPPLGESPLELRAGDRVVGTLYVREGPEPNLAIRRRFLPALASLLAVATDRERFAAKAMQAEALSLSDSVKTAILRTVSHDLRTPLTAIRVASESLASGHLELSEADRQELWETIRLESARLDRLVANLLDLSRLEAGAARPERQAATIDDLVFAAVASLGSDERRVEVALPPDTTVVDVDPAQIERALVNVLDNALKFSAPIGVVHLRASSTRKEAIIRVVDQGPGLPADELERVFEPFIRSAEGEDRGGTGLGLAIARGFVEANGGRVWAESQPGQGASFALALPLASVAVEVSE
jgi:two-component system sensor histidine kinase KdpD